MAPLTLNDFLGEWRIERRIDDILSGNVGMLAGTATFSPAPQGLAYLETGKLSLDGGAPLHAERRYLWRLGRGRIHVDYADHTPFHSFDPSKERTSARHNCAPDDYRVIYTFGHWPHWRANWRVEGPRKNYRMTTEYRR